MVVVMKEGIVGWGLGDRGSFLWAKRKIELDLKKKKKKKKKMRQKLTSIKY